MKVARYWNLESPSKWDSLSEDDRVRMIADYESDMTVIAWENHLQTEEAKKQEFKAGR